MDSRLNDNVKLDVVTADDIPEDKRRAIFDRQASVDAIPDLDVLTGNVYEILQYLEDPRIRKLQKTNDSAVKMHLNTKYADTVPLGIITVLMEEESRFENVERLLKMFEQLRKAKAGEISLETAEQTVTEDVNERYLYSKYGSKDAFEKALAGEIQKEQRKKNLENVTNLKDIGKINIKK